MKENPVDIFQKFFESRMENVHTSIPGEIVKYAGHSKRLASVKPLVRLKALDGSSVPLPVIDNVPVVFPSSGEFSLLFPVKKGDGCLISFCESGIGNWIAGSGQEVDADDSTRFSLTDAVCFPGLWASKNVAANKTIELTELGQLVFLEGSESFVKGDTFEVMLNSFLTPISQIVPGDMVANAAALGVIKAAAAAMLASLPTMKSLKIKGV